MIAPSPDQAQTSVKVQSHTPTRRYGEKSSKVRKSCVDTAHIKVILDTMAADQRDHSYANFGEAYSAYRRVVAGWILDIGDYFSLHPTTTHAAVAYLDRLHLSKFSKREWQMLAISCILIAAKYNEKEQDVPDLRTLEDIVKQPIPNEILLKYEMWTLQRMGWKLNVHTPMAFIACYAAYGICYTGDTCYTSPSGQSSKTSHFPSRNTNSATSYEVPFDVLDARITEECYSLASVALLECSLKSYRASDIASAIVFFARKSLCVVPVWNDELTALTRNDMRSDAMKNMFHMLENLLPSAAWEADKREKVYRREVKREEREETGTESNQMQSTIYETHAQTATHTQAAATVQRVTHSVSHDKASSAQHHITESVRHTQTLTQTNENENVEHDEEGDEEEGTSQYLSAALIPLQLSESTSSNSSSSPSMVPIAEYPISAESHRNYLPEIHTPLENKENACRDTDREDGANVRPSPTSVVIMDSLVGV